MITPGRIKFRNEDHLLYVACTPARDRVAITSVKSRSGFIPDLMT
jgi:hypothetical protein